MLAPKSGDGEISGMSPGISHTLGSSWTCALSVVYRCSCWVPIRPRAASATAMIEVFSVKTDRSDCTVDTALSQDAPLLPPSADVGPVPVWNSPYSPE